MNPANLDLLFGWTLYLSAAATLATAVTAILFFTLGGRFGKINDAVSVLQMLLMLPVSVGLFLLIRHGGARLALLAAVVGAVGMLVAAMLQTLLVLDVVKYEQTITAVLTAGGAIGLWLLLANILAFSIDAFPSGLAISGIVVGAGYILVALGFRIGGQEHPLSYAGAVLVIVGYSVWSIWLGWLFASGRLTLESCTTC
ncbi:MAG: hypothetical protein P8X48_13015 [Acidiferrobacteraceae bacterium]